MIMWDLRSLEKDISMKDAHLNVVNAFHLKNLVGIAVAVIQVRMILVILVVTVTPITSAV